MSTKSSKKRPVTKGTEDSTQKHRRPTRKKVATRQSAGKAVTTGRPVATGLEVPEPTRAGPPGRGRGLRPGAASVVAERPSGSEAILDDAADLAAQHPALQGKRPLVRALLGWEAELGILSLALGGSPRRVLRAEDLASERQARLAGEAIARIWQEEMLEPRAAAAALGVAATNRQRVADLRQRSVLLGLPHGNRHLFPLFQFDLERRAVRPEVEAVNRLLEAAADPWGAASWWVSPNAWLGSARPMDLAGTVRGGELLTAAETLVEPAG